jgi:DNA replication protein DnaC
VREGRRFKQALKLAGLPYHKTLDGFDVAFQPDLDVVRGKELATLRGGSIYFTTLEDLVQQLKIAESRHQLQHKLKTYLKPTLLVIDEVGYLPLNRVEAHDLFPWIWRRYERGSVIVTRNKAFSEWAALLGDDILAAAILDRLLHHAEVLPMNGPSYRLKDRLTLGRAGSMARTS